MPRVARFKIAAIGDLCRQLMYAPAEARRRHLDAAEQLVAQIEPGQVYPQEFVIFRITAYRSDRPESPTALVGEALVGDLVTLIQRLSQSLDIASDDAGRTAVPLEDLARRLKISAKTLQRYRQQGLVCHYLVFPDGGKRLACFEDAVDRFVSRNRGRLDRAATFSRVDDAVQETIISEAREQHEARGLSLNAVAKQLAEKYGRAHETLRSILSRHDRAAVDPIFAEPGPLRDRDVRLIHRAAHFGIAPATLARHFGKTPATIHRAVNRGRRELLEKLDLSFVTLAPMDEDDAEAAILGEPAVTENLGPMLPQHDALALIEAARAVTSPDRDREHTLACAFNLLKRRAGRSIKGLGQDSSARELDRVETDLRWAPMIERRLVEIGLPGAVAAIELDLGRDLTRQPSDEIVDLLRLAVEVVGQTVAVFDPGRRSLVRAAGDAMSRRLGQQQRRPRAGRAATRHRPGSVMLVGAFERLCPWQAWLGLRPDLHEAVAALDAGPRRLVELRYGLGGGKPRTFVELAELTEATPSNVARRIAGAEATLRQIRRSEI
jgi:DNA-directed RNA polymerase specialized sigma24 family protein